MTTPKLKAHVINRDWCKGCEISARRSAPRRCWSRPELHLIVPNLDITMRE
jgi:hypothetical protein